MIFSNLVTKYLTTLHPKILQREYTKQRSDLSLQHAQQTSGHVRVGLPPVKEKAIARSVSQARCENSGYESVALTNKTYITQLLAHSLIISHIFSVIHAVS